MGLIIYLQNYLVAVTTCMYRTITRTPFPSRTCWRKNPYTNCHYQSCHLFPI